jgi:RimJ/RimL family protein N-acetyltransferase
MLTKVLQEHPVAFLECVQKNAGSWRLYQRLGFEIECEYPGVFDVPCFKMEYRKEAK